MLDLAEHLELRHGQQGATLPRSASSVALASSLVVSSGVCLAFGFSVLSTNGSAQFVQVFDLAAVPSNGAVPVAVFTVAANANLPVAWTPGGRAFTTGLVLCNSSTAATLTIGVADCWFDCQYV